MQRTTLLPFPSLPFTSLHFTSFPQLQTQYIEFQDGSERFNSDTDCDPSSASSVSSAPMLTVPISLTGEIR